ncbi:MAG: twin-arginine translocase TatA/TatE family subunit [Odoribacteraceae bacterium]|nr:twin-arginine translocase TatA/TatE family subunit [Odoribacteraceae bacterium]
MLIQFLTDAVTRVECGLGTPEIIGIALIVLLLFGGRKIPELMRGLGRGVKSFKDGMNGLGDEDKPVSDAKKKDE